MPLESGTRLGPYEILGLIGAGGMGEVYRARDPRLGRDVAVKVLPRGYAKDPERLQRFEQEARAAGQLNHPNVLAIYDVGVAADTPYLVTELLEGETLRQTISRGPLPPRTGLDYVLQTTRGLEAAHAKGIIHRDLKPENLLVTAEGRVKILDFGLAKLTRREGAPTEETSPALYSVTEAGEVVGTASYMAPEQIRGAAADHRADLFALAAILFEILTGERAFPGETAADRMSAILRADPAPVPDGIERAVPGVGLLIARCLAKRPEGRLDTVKDFGFALELLTGGPSGGRPDTGGAPAAPVHADLSFHRLTFREGEVVAARFAPDGQTVAYSAAWEGSPAEVFLTRADYPESRPIGVGAADILSLARTSELAVLVRQRDVGGFVVLGTLARVPLMGGIPREMIEAVYQADWAPDGKTLAVVRQVGGLARLEYPVGTILYEAEGWLSHPRVSPDGTRVAVFHHPVRGNNSGSVLSVGREGAPRTLSSGWEILMGSAWAPDRASLWVSGHRTNKESLGIFEVGEGGAVRVLYRGPGFTQIQDVSASGDVLITNGAPRMRLEFATRGGGPPRNLAWLDWSLLRDLSADGARVLTDESATGAGSLEAIYMRSTDASPAVRIGEGFAPAFSPDQRWVIAIDQSARNEGLVLFPVGPGQAVHHPTPGVRLSAVRWFPGGKSLCVSGTAPGKKARIYRYDLDRRDLTPISEEGVGAAVGQPSPDGAWLPASTPDGGWAICPTAGGSPRPLQGIREQERPIQWAADGRALFTFERGVLPAPVRRVEIETGRSDLVLEIEPVNPGGVRGINNVALARDGEVYAYSYVQILSELNIVSGLR
jgi:hypothetical protein